MSGTPAASSSSLRAQGVRLVLPRTLVAPLVFVTGSGAALPNCCCGNGLVRAQGLLTARRYRARPLCEVRRYHARAERTGRSARLIERDRAKCDLIVRRWQEFTGGTARLAGGCETFAEAAVRRASDKPGGDH